MAASGGRSAGVASERSGVPGADQRLGKASIEMPPPLEGSGVAGNRRLMVSVLQDLAIKWST
jgi:hypothetical protein